LTVSHRYTVNRNINNNIEILGLSGMDLSGIRPFWYEPFWFWAFLTLIRYVFNNLLDTEESDHIVIKKCLAGGCLFVGSDLTTKHRI